MLRSILKFPLRVARGVARRVLRRPKTDAPPPVDRAPLPPTTEDDPWPAPASASSHMAAPDEDPWPAPASASLPAEPAAAVVEEPAKAEEPAKVEVPDEPAVTETPTPAEEREAPKKGKAKAKKEKAKRAVTVSGQATPNPNAMKFTCSSKVIAKGSMSYENAAVAKKDPLASAVFEVSGVKSIFAVNDFVTVTKEPNASWDDLQPRLETVIAESLSR